MKTIASIFALHPVSSIRIENAPYMPLCIERIGNGPRGLPAVSVCHYGEQNGDLMRDPEMCFEVIPAGANAVADTWAPFYFRNDYVGLEQNVFDDSMGKLTWKPKLFAELAAFARTWDRNLREQGFIQAARLQQLAAVEAERADLRARMQAAAEASIVAPSLSVQADFLAAQPDLFA